jgi:AcrR family transcriptional regulator
MRLFTPESPAAEFPVSNFNFWLQFSIPALPFASHSAHGEESEMKELEKPLASVQRTCLDATLKLLAERGPRGFTFKDVARHAHLELATLEQNFSSLDELLLAIAIEGFAKLAVMTEKDTAKQVGAMERLKTCAVDYVRFAIHWPAHFAIMFEMPRSLQEQRPSEPRHMNAFGVLIRIIEQAQEEGVLPDVDAVQLSLSYWAFVHGIAKLATSHTLPMPEEQILALTARVAETMTKGLNVR